MDHWFDELTKSLASAQPSRRSVIATMSATLAAAGGARWDFARAAAPSRPAPPSTATKTATFGPCTVLSKGGHYEHHLVSRASASGHNAELRRTRTIDPKAGATHDTTILVDGKTQLQTTATFTKSSETHKFIFGNGLVPGGAVLTVTDGGKTLRGTIGGKTIAPYTIGSGKKLQFVNGAPKGGKATPGVSDAVEAVAKQADADLERCTSSAHAFVPSDTRLAKMAGYSAEITSRCGGYPGEMLSLESGNPHAPNMTCGEYYILTDMATHNGRWQGQANTNTWFTPLCEACNNKCGGNLFDEIVNVIGCAAEAYFTYCADGCLKCGKAVNYSSKQFNCQQGCLTGKACDPVPCGANNEYGNLSCSRDEICVTAGICCPKTHPKPCGPAGSNVYGWMNFSNQPGPGQPWIGGFCCDEEAPCLYDTRFGSQSTSYYDNGYYCCPKAQICGSFKNGVYVGACCYPKQHCCGGSCCPPETVCATQATSYMATKGNPNAHTPGGAKVCCHPKAVRNGECCQSFHWCGDQCCGASSAFGCPKGKCPPQPTACLTGVHCGFVCCETGCANPETSTCKSTSKCAKPHYECLTFPEMGATSVCCPKGITCAGGKCCPKGTKACQHVTTGKIGCYPAAQCAPPLPPPK